MSINNRRTVRANSRHAPLVASVLAMLASAAAAQAVTEWDLPGQPLANSLRDVAARTDSNILFDKKLVMGHSARPLKTRATVEEILTQLLEGTGLTYRQLDDKTVTIQQASADQAATTSSVHGGGDGRIRLARAETGAGRTKSARSESVGPSMLLLEELVVTGTNIRGIENNTAPITVLSRAYIEATGYSTTTRLLESVIQNFALTNKSGINTPGVSGNNREQGSALNLRGIGEGTTLVLLNGRRLAPGFRSAAVDISALPLSAIERVEILTDGASALYGSDAVGGVVNFILREDFDGAETRVRAGAADNVDEYRLSQALGSSWGSGNALVSLEYYRRDALLASDRDFVPPTALVGTLAPEDRNYSGIVTARQDLTGSVSVFFDGLYTTRDSSNRAGRVTFNETTRTDNDQAAATFGLGWNMFADWQLEMSGSYARNDLEQYLTNRTSAGAANNSNRDMVFGIEGGEIKADGTLFDLPGGATRAAIGVAYRGESYEDVTISAITGALQSRNDVDQNIRSAFGEVYVPLVGKDNAFAGANRLELLLAGRYDDYSTAGSSFDPQAGLMWEPVAGLRLRARHGTSYKAPNLVDSTYALNLTSSVRQPVAGVPTEVMQVLGIDVDSLRPQESESSSFGLEFTPLSMPGLAVALNYYKIRYTGQIATPAGSGAAAVMLTNPSAYGDLIIRDPSVDVVNQFIALGLLGRGFGALLPNGRPNPAFTPESVDVIVDGRRRNLSSVRAEGVDLAGQYEFGAGESRTFLGLSGTYILKQEQRITDSSVPVDIVDTIYNPPDWRARGFVGWQLRGWGTSLFVNHTDSYVDSRLLTRPAIDSYTTVDARVSYDFSKRFGSGVLSGVTVALNAQNVLDEEPPRVGFVSGVDSGFDATNADPLGRFLSLEISKTW